MKINYKEHTKMINKLQKRHPGTRRQRSSHGAGQWSVQFFDIKTGKLMADYDLPPERYDYEEEERHASGCICADCSDAELTAEND